MNKKKNRRKGVMYSTNPDFEYIYEENQIKTLQPREQNLTVLIDKKRAGRIAVIIKGYIGSNNDLDALSKLLKTQCAVGGTAKNGEIIIQGDVRDKVIDILEKEGYNYKRAGG
ncbi:MAG: translation initiation factor [Flavobacteriales bacterium]|nr:translation initiation factor [Flavobacteriales bacterium]